MDAGSLGGVAAAAAAPDRALRTASQHAYIAAPGARLIKIAAVSKLAASLN